MLEFNNFFFLSLILSLAEHMRHRVPKNEQDQAFYFPQQSQDCEKTVVEPDLTNGLIRRLQDSDEEFDEDEVDDEDDEITETTPPAAHSQPLTSVVGTLPHAIIKTEETRNLLKNIEKEVQDLSKKTMESKTNAETTTDAMDVTVTASIATPTPLPTAVSLTSIPQQQQQASSISSTSCMGTGLSLVTTAPAVTVAASNVSFNNNTTSALSSSSVSSVSSTTSSNSSSAGGINSLNVFQSSPPLAHTTALAVAATLASMNGVSAATVANAVNFNNSCPINQLPSAMVLPNTCLAATALQQKIRSVSPPPLYNKAHHPPPSANVVMSKERSDDFPLNASSCLHGSHEHLNFTKHSYTNGLIPALKLKRPRLSEDSNFNGSSTMDTSTSNPLVPEDDDYHYLLSLHPYMKQLTAAQKLRIRTKIQKLIFKELYKEDLEESK